MVDKELSTYNINDDNNTLLLDNLCGLVNKSGICFFNSAMQLLFSDRHFTYFLLSNKFESQTVSESMQRICYKMLTNKKVNLESEMLILAQESELTDHLRINSGGFPDIVATKILKQIKHENPENYQNGSPVNYINKRKLGFKCKCGKVNKDTVQFVFFEIDSLGVVNKILKQTIDNTYSKATDKIYRCVYCAGTSKRKLCLEYSFANNLFLQLDYKSDTPKCLAEDFLYQTQLQIQIGNKKYELYSIVCVTRIKKEYHANTLAKKGKKWYLMDDSRIKRVDVTKKKKGTFHWLFAYKLIKTTSVVTSDDLLEVIK
ncbi:hypothetical protein BDAP_001372 [Binucleata daphniae]